MIRWPELPGVLQPQTRKAWLLLVNDALKNTEHLLVKLKLIRLLFLFFFSLFFLAPLA